MDSSFHPFFELLAMLSSLSMHVCACCCMDSFLKFFCSLLFSPSFHAFPPAVYFSAFLAFFARFFPRYICCCSFSFNDSSTDSTHTEPKPNQKAAAPPRHFCWLDRDHLFPRVWYTYICIGVFVCGSKVIKLSLIRSCCTNM